MKKKDSAIKKVNMTITINKEFEEDVKRHSFQLSVDEQKKIGTSEVVRRALKYYFDNINPFGTQKIL